MRRRWLVVLVAAFGFSGSGCSDEADGPNATAPATASSTGIAAASPTIVATLPAPSAPTAQLTVIKHVVNDSGETSLAGDFTIQVVGRGLGITTFPGQESPGTTIALGSGPFSVSESGPDGYGATMDGDCAGLIRAGETLTCTIINDDREPTLEGDAALTGNIEYERTSSYLEDEPQLPHVARTEAMSATIDVSMNRDAFDDNAFVDDGSTYEVDRSTHDERQNGNCMAIFDTRSLGTYAFTDRPNGPEFENYIGGYIDRTSGIVVLSVVIHYPYLVTADECNDSPLPNFGIADALLCSGPGLEGKLTEISAAPDEVDFECTADIDAMDYDTQTVTVSGVLELR